MRLTERDKDGNAYWNGKNGVSYSDIKGNIYGNAITKLAEYEDSEEQCIEENQCGIRELLLKWKAFFDDIAELYDYRKAEEQGLLHKTPCKMGDTIYFIDEESGKVFQSIVARFWIAKLQSFVIDYDGRRFNFKQFGKTWFLDSEEAEAALAEKGGA